MRVPICTPSAPSAKAAAVADAACRDDRDVDARAHQRKQHEARDRCRTLEASSLSPFDDQAVDPGVDGLQRGAQGRDDVVDREPCVLQRLRVLGRTACGGRDEADTLLGDEVDDRRIAYESLRNVDAERAIRELAHLSDLDPDRVELTRGGLDDAEGAGLRDRRGEGRSGDPAHRSLDDRNLDAESAGDAVVESHAWGPPGGRQPRGSGVLDGTASSGTDVQVWTGEA